MTAGQESKTRSRLNPAAVSSPFAALIRDASGASGEIVSHTSLRGIAALCVVFYHASLPLEGRTYALQLGFFKHSYLFVDLFFILSGFIITEKYAEWFAAPRATDVRAFLQNRFARIYPNYLFWFLVALALSMALEVNFTGGISFGRAEIVSFAMHLLMLQSILLAPEIWNVPLWSITVEFVAYALFPVLAFGLMRHGRRFLAAGAALGAFVLAAMAAAGTIDVTDGALSIARGFAGFVIGAFIATVSRDNTVPLPTPVLSLLQAGTCAAIVAVVSLRLEIAAVGCFALLVYLTIENRGACFAVCRRWPLHALGLLSYSIYLAHTLVQRVLGVIWHKLRGDLPFDAAQGFLVLGFGGALVTILVAVVSYRFVEVPGRSLLRAHRRVPAPSSV